MADAQYTTRQAVAAGVLLAGVIELATVALRFGAGLEATRDTRSLAPYTFGWRVHHGYIGALFLIAALRVRGRTRLVCIGLGLLLSDLAHHFLVLWPLTGSPQFDLRYPAE